jgi:hypothetical protein
MTDKDYIRELEDQNEHLRKNLENHNLILDIIKAKVNIIDSNFFKLIHPKQLCSYVESLGWVLKYEKTHERYLTRCYLSPHKDTKCKVFMQDLYQADDNTNARRMDADGMSSRVKEVVSLIARIHKKGELEVIFEILSTREP